MCESSQFLQLSSSPARADRRRGGQEGSGGPWPRPPTLRRLPAPRCPLARPPPAHQRPGGAAGGRRSGPGPDPPPPPERISGSRPPSPGVEGPGAGALAALPSTQSSPCERGLAGAAASSPAPRPSAPLGLFFVVFVHCFSALIAWRLGTSHRGSGEKAWPRAPTQVLTDSRAPHPFADVGPPGQEEVAWELSEEVFPLSPFYFGVKVGDGFDQRLILGHPNPLGPAWVPGRGLEGLGSAREGGGDLDLAPSDPFGALVPSPRNHLSRKNTLSILKGSKAERKRWP